MLKLPWYGNLVNAFNRATPFAIIPLYFNLEKNRGLKLNIFRQKKLSIR